MRDVNKKVRWKTLSHNGPYLPKHTQKDITIEASVSCGGKPLNQDIKVPHEAALVVQRLNHTLKKDIATSIEKKQFTDRFWNTWWKAFVPKCKDPRIGSGNHTGLTRRSFDAMSKITETSKESVHVPEKHQYARVDGVLHKIANFHIEPPGVFLGRGDKHPYAGSVKRAITSSDITINIGKDDVVPIPSDGGKWACVVHRKDASWLASWKDPSNGKTKYMRLAVRKDEDQRKFHIARTVMRALPAARLVLSKLLKRNLAAKIANTVELQTICCFLLMDRFALRVGGDRSGRVFGVTTLQSRHVHLSNTCRSPHLVELSFVGKDSMACSSMGFVTPELYDCLSFLCRRKGMNAYSDIFDDVNERVMNEFITMYLPSGATAKSIRTARACETYERVLLSDPILDHIARKDVNRYRSLENIAVASVALLCNHHRKVAIATRDGQDGKKAIDLWRVHVISKSSSRIKQLDAKRQAVADLNLSTSLSNYIDPRITRAYEARYDLVAGSCSSPLLRVKFAWSFGTDPNFRFSDVKSV